MSRQATCGGLGWAVSEDEYHHFILGRGRSTCGVQLDLNSLEPKIAVETGGYLYRGGRYMLVV
jgi:hypothetical protein